MSNNTTLARLGEKPRESLANIGANCHPHSYKWIQNSLTWVTGMPHKGEIPAHVSRLSYLVSAITQLGFGVATSALLWHKFPQLFILLVFPYLVTVGAARDLLPSIAHMCMHFRFTNSKEKDLLIADFITTFLVLQDADGYFVDHVKRHHNPNTFTTLEDPDEALLYNLGFCPGLPKEIYWQKLYQTMISPSFHWLFLKGRFLSNFVTASLHRRFMSWTWLTVILTVVITTNSFSTFLVAWVIPLTFFYHNAALLQFCSEHLWYGTSGSRSLGRFCGEAPPDTSFSEEPVAWLIWLLRMVFYHIPVRIAILPGTLPVHDYHHRHASNNDWVNEIYCRQQEIEAGAEGYIDIWGLHNALDYVFEHLSNTPAIPED
ncbi:MAG: hypothetical protein WCO45_06635 [Pseudanabaena sp. ELA607]|jgi:hypothetical protein